MVDDGRDRGAPERPAPGCAPRVWLAVGFGLWAVGLGQVYAGRGRRGLALWGASMALLIAALRSPMLTTFAGLGVWVGGAGAFWIWSVVDAARQARARRGAPRPAWSRGAACVGFGVVAALVAWAVTELVPSRVRPFVVPSGSMEPAVVVGDRMIAEIHRPGEAEPGRGDIVLFVWPDEPGSLHFDRVMGLPGETIELRAKKLFVDGLEVPDPWGVHRDPRTYPPAPALDDFRRLRDSFGPLTLDDSSYFLLGDNRDFSHDSRFRGPVPRTAIFGRPLYLYAAKDWRRIGRRVE